MEGIAFYVHRLVIAVTVLVLISAEVAIAQPEVTLPSGTLMRGMNIPYNESEYLGVDTTFEAFMGIPYAKPPLDGLRFQNPVKETLGNFYFAASDRPICPQLIGDLDEDCLYLSVHRASSSLTNAPVMVFIHGGGYTLGAGSMNVFDPTPLIALSPGIIVVNINYRLGILGYLTTGDSHSRGNYGMFDQVMALEWVQENIVAFGGDPAKVTIMGESAGAASVSLHMLSPLSQNLFNQAIMESGNALSPWAVDTNMSRQVGFTGELADLVNCTGAGSDNEALVDCLRGVSVADLMSAQYALTLRHLTNELLFVPVVDDAFLPDTPLDIIQSGRSRNVPTLLGTNEDEGTLLALRKYPSYVLRQKPPMMSLEDFRDSLHDYLYYNVPLVISAVEQWYVDWARADNSSENHIDAFIRLNTDQMFACSTEALSRSLESSGVPVYRYEMTHDPSWSIFAGVPGWLGAGHGEDLQFVFAWGLRGRERIDQTHEEKLLSVQFMRYWTNFIISGDPNSPVSSPEYPPWPRYTLPDQDYKKLSITMENGQAMRSDACAFWLNYVPTLYIYDLPGDELYRDWQEEYVDWRDVHMTEWEQTFQEYQDDSGCDAP